MDYISSPVFIVHILHILCTIVLFILLTKWAENCAPLPQNIKKRTKMTKYARKVRASLKREKCFNLFQIFFIVSVMSRAADS